MERTNLAGLHILLRKRNEQTETTGAENADLLAAVPPGDPEIDAAGGLAMVRLLLLLCLVGQVEAAPRTHRAAFMKLHPCPANGHTRGACPGYVIDHIWPLACGGEDHPRNMQWQTVAEAKAKDKWERKVC